MKFNVTIDRDEDGVWIIECPSIPGCISQGATKEEALDNIQDAKLKKLITENSLLYKRIS
jgi:predicted RNase H-like HicB family nuclease